MIDIAGWSLKRLAWAYGWAPKDSDEERELRTALRQAAIDDIVNDDLHPWVDLPVKS